MCAGIRLDRGKPALVHLASGYSVCYVPISFLGTRALAVNMPALLTYGVRKAPSTSLLSQQGAECEIARFRNLTWIFRQLCKGAGPGGLASNYILSLPHL